MGKASRRKRERKLEAPIEQPALWRQRDIQIFRYLEEEGHVAAWTTGGRVPIRQALYYRTLEGGTGRADSEDSMHRTVSGMQLRQVQNPGPGPSPIRIAPGANIGSLEFNDCTFSGPNGSVFIERGRLSQHHPPGLVLCLSKTLSKETAHAIDPKCKYCVRVVDIARLKAVIDQHLGTKGVSGSVQYTSGDNRHTFLKSTVYRQQDEYRLAWEGLAQEDVWVDLPPGISERVEIPT